MPERISVSVSPEECWFSQTFLVGQPMHLAGGVSVRYAGIVSRCPVGPSAPGEFWFTIAFNVQRAESVYPEYWTIRSGVNNAGGPMPMDPFTLTIAGINGAPHKITVRGVGKVAVGLETTR